MDIEGMNRLDQIATGVTLISGLVKEIKKPIDKNSLKELKDNLSILRKKYKMLYADESLRPQYLDRTCYDTVQGVFQTFHLYIISTDGKNDEKVVPIVLEWLRGHDTAYEISKRMQDAAMKRADFAGAKK